MSSTSRGSTRPKHDYFVTDPDEVEQFLLAWKKDDPGAVRVMQGKILDPCAGGNVKPVKWRYNKEKPPVTIPPTGMSYPMALEHVLHAKPNITTMDIRENSPAEKHGDFLKTEPSGSYDLVITNPPFSIAMEVILHALKHTIDGGYVVMLLRLNFFGSDMRFNFFRDNAPVLAYVHHKRMGFIPGINKTDSIEYAHMVWKKGHPKYSTQLRVI